MLRGIFRRSGKKVLHDDGPVPSVIPEENSQGVGPMGVAAQLFRGLPQDTFMYYVYATPEDKAAHYAEMKAGKYLFYKSQTIGASYNAIDEIFKRAPKGVIATYEVAVSDEEGWKGLIYVNMMSVRPGWKRNGLNMAMMRSLVAEYPERKLAFSDPTPEGAAFIEAAKAAGLPVAK